MNTGQNFDILYMVDIKKSSLYQELKSCQLPELIKIIED